MNTANGLNMTRKKSESTGGSTSAGTSGNGSLGDIDKKISSISTAKDPSKDRKSIVDSLIRVESNKSDGKDTKAQNKENTTKITKDPKNLTGFKKK